MNESLASQAGTAVFWRGIQLLATRVLSLARFLILARLLTPESFGLLAVAATSLEAALTVTDFGMEPALAQRGKKEEGHYDVAWTVRFTRSCAVAVGVALLAPFVADIFDAPGATNVVRVLALRPVIESLGSIKVADLLRALEFRALAMLAVPATLAEATVSIVGAEVVVAIALADTWGVWALVAGALAGAAVGVVVSYIIAPYRPRFSFDRAASSALFRFGRWIFVTSLIGVVGGAVLQAVVSRRLGATELGLYWLGMRIAFIPNELITDVVRDVAFPLHARLQTELERSARAFRSSLLAMLALLGPIYAALLVLAPSLSEHVLGSGWSGTGPVIQILSVVGILGAIADATMPMLQGVGRPQFVAALYAIRSLVVVILVWPLATSYGVKGAAAAWLSAEVIVQLASIGFAARILPKPFRGMARPLTAMAVVSTISGAVAWLVDQLAGGVVGVFVGGALGMLAGGSALLLADVRWRLRLLTDFARAYPRVAERLRITDRGSR